MFTFMLILFLLINIRRAKRGDLYIRRIPGLDAIEEAVGRATEMGKPVLMVPGLGALNAISVQALRIFAHVSKIAAKFANPIRLCCGEPAVYTVAQEIIRDAYQESGMMDRYDADSVRFISDRQFAFAAGVSGIIHREKTAAAFFLGEFFAESCRFARLFAERLPATGPRHVAVLLDNTPDYLFAFGGAALVAVCGNGGSRADRGPGGRRRKSRRGRSGPGARRATVTATGG